MSKTAKPGFKKIEIRLCATIYCCLAVMLLWFSSTVFSGGSALTTREKDETSNVTASNAKQNRIELISGEVTQFANSQCEYLWGNEEVVRLSADCNIVAQHIGKIGVLRMFSDGGVKSEYEIRVKPHQIERYEIGKKSSFSVASGSSQQWFLIEGLSKGTIYRGNFSGELDDGTRFRLVADNGRSNNSCAVTFFKPSKRISCYFGASREVILLVVDRPGRALMRVDFDLHAVDTLHVLENFDQLYATAKTLSLGTAIEAFVLSNEIGSNSKHYYQYNVSKNEGVASPNLQVKLFDYDMPLSLNVMWIDGYCDVNLMEKTAKYWLCKLPASFVGDLTIVVDGNADVMNAASGGSRYKIMVEPSQ